MGELLIRFVLALILGGCVSQPYYDDMMMVDAQMTWKADIKDVWTRGCPKYGDCEDFALCLFDKMSFDGKKPSLHVCDTNLWGRPYSHAIVELDGWYYDPVNQIVRTYPTCHVVKTYSYLQVLLKAKRYKR